MAAWCTGGGCITLLYWEDGRSKFLSMCGSYRQVAEALGHLPDVGYIQVEKTEDGTEQAYTVPASDDDPGAGETIEPFSVWEWEVTFQTKSGDLPLMAAVWSDGRTLPGENDGFEMMGRATRLTCESCQTFESDSWSATAESIVGLRMEVRQVQSTPLPSAQ